MQKTGLRLKGKTVIFLMLALVLFGAKGQKPDLNIVFEGIGDNREFSSGKSLSQTILGSRGSIEAGISSDNHGLRAGLSRLFEFGNPIDGHKPQMILYYRYEDKHKTFHFGSFPRRQLVSFPLAIFTDTLLYYRPNIEGLRGELRWGSGYQNAFVDWTARQAAGVREAFTAASSGEMSLDHFFIQNYLVLNHLAHSKPRQADEHVNDNLGYCILLGWRSHQDRQWTGFIKAGMLASVYRDRSVSDGFVHAQSLLAEGGIRWGNFSGKSVLHTGEGHIFLSGDPFYRTSNYLRSDVVWHFINHKNIQGRFNLSFHLIEWSHIDQSQQISLVYSLPVF